ncbi:MAG: 30S ribosomal protein S13 [Candidatus Sigynarchaeota archaeon]
MSEGDFKQIVRVLGTNIDGNRLLVYGLSEVQGIGIRFATSMVRILGLDASKRIGFLDDQTLAKLEDIAKNPLKYNIPGWMLNRRKDYRTGDDRHIVSSDLAYIKKLDIDRLRRIKCWRGIRHALNLKVRGQRTRTTGRSGLIMGVSRKKQA